MTAQPRTVAAIKKIGRVILPSDVNRVAHAAFVDGFEQAMLACEEQWSPDRFTAFLRENAGKFPVLNGPDREDTLVILRTVIAGVSMALTEQRKQVVAMVSAIGAEGGASWTTGS